jgi:RNA polymerase sigma-70 factor (ECF subfamily)
MDSDTELARKAAAGDTAAFTALVRLHESKVRRFLDRLLRGDGAEDLAQEVFLKAWRMARSWREEGPYGAWLMRIAWTSFLSHNKTRGRQRDRETAACDPDPGKAGNAEAAIDLQRALAGLSERERAAALLCFGEGCSHSEAAAILDLPLGTVKSLVARARTRILAYLEKKHD